MDVVPRDSLLLLYTQSDRLNALRCGNKQETVAPHVTVTRNDRVLGDRQCETHLVDPDLVQKERSGCDRDRCGVGLGVECGPRRGTQRVYEVRHDSKRHSRGNGHKVVMSRASCDFISGVVPVIGCRSLLCGDQEMCKSCPMLQADYVPGSNAPCPWGRAVAGRDQAGSSRRV